LIEVQSKFWKYLSESVSPAPLVILRVVFGLLMFASTLRFMLKAWVHQMYVAPQFFFPYYGFEWVKPLSEWYMYAAFVILLIASLGIAFGFLYRVSSVIFFIVFTYVELIDKTNYLNHYYFVSIISFLLIWVPAHRYFSLDNKIFKMPEINAIPRVYIVIFQLQMALVYFFAGIAKINTDWLLEAQPLNIWLPALSHLPIIGGILSYKWTAYIAAWFSCIYDLFIAYFLWNKKTTHIAYVFVVIFHLLTAMFFNIGMFPYIMMCITLIFLKPSFHLAIINRLKTIFRYQGSMKAVAYNTISKPIIILFLIHFLLQLFLPFRYLFYKQPLFWAEQGYRFSWRVMLMEKAGTTFFTVKDQTNHFEEEVNNREHLNYMQEKMMSTQPDMILQYAHYLKQVYEHKNWKDVKVYVKSYVTINGSGTRPFVNDTVDLTSIQFDLKEKVWLMPYHQ
jgi:hypothetical protein